MESVLPLVSVNSESERGYAVFNQEHSFPFQRCDISLPVFHIYRRINENNSGLDLN